MYKDTDKQRAANRQAQARFKAKGITRVLPEQGITKPVPVIPIERLASGRPVMYCAMADMPYAYVSDLVYDKRNAWLWYGQAGVGGGDEAGDSEKVLPSDHSPALCNSGHALALTKRVVGINFG